MTDTLDYIEDTIVAIATPPGTGGVGVVRISGPKTEQIARAMLGCLPKARYATLKKFIDPEGNVTDSGIALWFPAPDSFTGEAVLELHGHGGPEVMSLLVTTAVELGARRAIAGEFSKRAFLNGKLDLAQAESIVDLINSGSAQGVRAAHRTLTGVFSAAIHDLAKRLTELRSHVEAAIDFPEEEIDFLADSDLLEKIEECETHFKELKRQMRLGRLFTNGVEIVIVGRPNTGKSSLLNTLSGEDSAIVTEFAGTTRDILREKLNIDGLLVELVDTAGLRESAGPIEAEGIRRATIALQDADIVLWMQDATCKDEQDLNEPLPDGIPVVVLRNKVDLTGDNSGQVSTEPVVLNISAKTGAGIDDLRNVIVTLVGYTDQGEGAFTARQRHVDALTESAEHFTHGYEVLKKEKAGELMAEELRLSHQALGKITGECTSDDLLGEIFSQFCIGK